MNISKISHHTQISHSLPISELEMLECMCVRTQIVLSCYLQTQASWICKRPLLGPQITMLECMCVRTQIVLSCYLQTQTSWICKRPLLGPQITMLECMCVRTQILLSSYLQAQTSWICKRPLLDHKLLACIVQCSISSCKSENENCVSTVIGCNAFL